MEKMTYPLTRTALLEDCQRLASLEGGVEPLFLGALERAGEMARLGAITNLETASLEPALLRTRDTWDEPDPLPEPKYSLVVGNLTREDRLAFSLGGLIGAAGATLVQPPSVEPEDSREALRYQESYIFRQVYLAGHEEAFDGYLRSCSQGTSEQALAEFLRTLFLRALASSHTIMPDMIAFRPWLDNLYHGIQNLSDEIEQLVEVYCLADPAKFQKYQIETRFYRTVDPAINAARLLQRGERFDARQLAEALAEGVNESRYGQALAIGVAALRDATRVWRRETKGLSIGLQAVGRA